MVGESYSHLADWYEYFSYDCDYKSWSQYFIDGLRKLNAGGSGLELGCGSGIFCGELARAGYRMSGADVSLPMLSRAERSAREKGLSVKFFRADVRSLKTPETYDFLISPNDCYNYVPQERLKQAFKGAERALKPGGVFWFDISSEKKLREKIANNLFADDGEKASYLWFNTLGERSVQMDIVLFVRRDDGAYERFDERHIQYIHTEQEVCEALASAGFTLLSVEGHLGESKEGAERLNFICRKK